MNNSPRNSLDFSSTGLEEFSSDSLLEVMQEKTEDESASKYVLIKHDFYSSDSDHGREFLADFISRLCDSSYKSIIIYLIDKGTLLLDKSNPLFGDMLQLIQKAETVIADQESIDFYGMDIISNSKILIQPAGSIAEELIYLSDILTLE